MVKPGRLNIRHLVLLPLETLQKEKKKKKYLTESIVEGEHEQCLSRDSVRRRKLLADLGQVGGAGKAQCSRRPTLRLLPGLGLKISGT